MKMEEKLELLEVRLGELQSRLLWLENEIAEVKANG